MSIILDVWEAYPEGGSVCVISRTKELAEEHGAILFGSYLDCVVTSKVTMTKCEIAEMDKNGYYYCNT